MILFTKNKSMDLTNMVGIRLKIKQMDGNLPGIVIHKQRIPNYFVFIIL